jgi:tetratricopeptide (TPR) repeat protein
LDLNQKAIALLEENKYDDSLKLFRKAVELSRNVQSLNNLAWIYCNEEDDDISALPLLEEAINMNPKSHFPYNLLGEIYCRQKKWESAKEILEKSISIHPSKIAYNNLAVANYRLGYIEDASTFFLLASEQSDYALYCHVKCLIELGDNSKAKSKLDTFHENDDEFVGEVDVADLYVELGCYEDAIKWFAKGWDNYSKQSDWVSRYVFSLLKMNNPTLSHKLLNEVINEKIEKINDASEEECDDDWTERDKQDYMKELLNEKNEYEQMFEKISSGHTPSMEFDTSIQGSCYLFGCKRHNHPEYHGYTV